MARAFGLARGQRRRVCQRADPQNATYVPRPEWYFLGAQQLLRIFQGEYEILGSFVLPVLGMLLLLALPWLDRNPSREPARRRFALSLGALAAAATVGLTGWGAVEIRTEEEAMAERIAAAAEEEPPPADEPPPPDEPELRRLGAQLWRELACDACHAEDGPGYLFGAPLLDVQGSRSSRAWSAAYLLEPTRIRLLEEGELPLMRMPDFLLEDVEAQALAVYMDDMRDDERVPPFDAGSPTQDELLAGERLYEDLDCASCHRLAGDGEPLGPDLDGIGSRRTAAYLRAIVIDPEGVVPGTSMTDYYLEEEEARSLARYLASLR